MARPRIGRTKELIDKHPLHRLLYAGVKYLYFTECVMDETLKNTMLFDFFGDMLTEKQQEYYDLYHNEDLSLSEIAESAGISKQGVYDIIIRAEKTLVRFEQKTGIFQKWFETRSILEQSTIIGEKIHPIVLSYFQLEKRI